MVAKKKVETLKGNPWWSLSYALTSLKNYPVRNIGIALVLAIGITLPTTVFVWTTTGTELIVNEYFQEESYQMALNAKPGESFESSNLLEAQSTAVGSDFIEYAHRVPSTIGILTGDFFYGWSEYSMLGMNYVEGIKDMRVVITTTEVLANWSRDFTWRGNFSLSLGQVLVSEQFVNYANEVHNITIDVGTTIDMDLLRYGARGDQVGTPTSLGRYPIQNLLVVGVYEINDPGSIIGTSFPSITRQNWDPLGIERDIILGITDSVIILEDEVGAEVVDEVAGRGFFLPVVLLRPSESGLLRHGAQNIGTNLAAFKIQLEEQYPNIDVDGLSEIWKLESFITTYLQSQILTIIAFPVLIMSLMLTVFTSETSISRRKGEISSLRAKGASFNQVFSTFMWESMFLSALGFVLGLGLSYIMAPLIGASTGLFSFDPNRYAVFMSHISFPPLSIIIAGAIALYLPASYLMHVSRRIDVSEVGQPTTGGASEDTEDVGIWRYVIGLAAVLLALLIMPEVVTPIGSMAIAEVLVATLLLFAASYLGSRAMRLVTARVSGGTSFLFGEKSLYLSQSLRKRKGQFIPLLVILTLTLTTTTMMLIQSSSFEATLQNELGYSIGADMRIESDPKPLRFSQTLLSYPGIFEATPIVETWAQVGTQRFFLEGVDPLAYMRIGSFSESSFVNNDSVTVLTALASVQNGIVISAYYGALWNKTVGDTVQIHYGAINGTTYNEFEVVGLMHSAPGFGVASTHDISGASFASQFGFQIIGGFAFVNLDFLSMRTLIDTSSLFLVDTVSYTDMTDIIATIEVEKNTHVFTLETFDVSAESNSIQLFLSGIQGLTMISFILCAAMGLIAIALFLGSAVMEREPEYAVFRALGGTKKQVVSMVFGEFAGSVVAAIAVSVFLGVVFGYAMSILTLGLSPFIPVLPEVLSFPFMMMMVVLSLESVVMLLSTYIPARRAGSTDPASVLRNL
ncbi:MAG: FtsX-like permease family protein [Candidatus Thorarchaeota archaeon]